VYALNDLCRDLGDIPHSLDPTTIRRKSRDRFAISPLLRQVLAGKSADIVVSPRNKGELIDVVRAAVRHKIPMTPRGGGTANYGQSVPLRGGILLDMTQISGVVWARNGAIRALAGTLMRDVDELSRPSGWELRLHPSTRAQATIGGFVAGGSGGMGSCMWGMLRDRGNITAMEVISAEAEPRTRELRGREVALVHHAYGTNAIITEVEMPANPAWTWIEAIVAFPDYMQALRFGIALAREAGIVKKLISLQEWPVPRLMRELGGIVPEGCSMANCMVTEATSEAFADMVAEFGGSIVSRCKEGQGPYGIPSYEFAFGHGLLQLQKVDPKYTGLQGLFPSDRLLERIGELHRHLAGRMPMRLEIQWSQGDVVAMGSPFVLFESEAQMAGLVETMQAVGASVANNHATGVREVGIKQIDERDIAFKRSMDPFNLLNPGKLDFEIDASEGTKSALPTHGWKFRRAVSN
jgi:FAD/FMN-containing dehydrogenase